MEDYKNRDILMDMLIDCAIQRLFGTAYKQQIRKPNSVLKPVNCELSDIEIVDVPIAFNYVLVFNKKTNKYDIASFLYQKIFSSLLSHVRVTIVAR